MTLPPLTARIRWLRQLNYALVLIVVGILMHQLFERTHQLRSDTEAFSLENTERNLRNAVFLETMRILAAEGAPALASRVGGNPLEWADWPDEAALERGAGLQADSRPQPPKGWRFDAALRVVEFTPSVLEGGPRRWRVAPVYADDNGNGRFDPPLEVARELRLERVGENSP